jgi:hypothetical protein
MQFLMSVVRISLQHALQNEEMTFLLHTTHIGDEEKFRVYTGCKKIFASKLSYSFVPRGQNVFNLVIRELVSFRGNPDRFLEHRCKY